jgi:hypothetical protein
MKFDALHKIHEFMIPLQPLNSEGEGDGDEVITNSAECERSSNAIPRIKLQEWKLEFRMQRGWRNDIDWIK